MPSHIGFESAVSADCWTLTRSLLAENSPYYESGLKLGFTSKNGKLNLGLLVLNGWQRIQKPDYIQNPSVGMQINYKSSAQLGWNYSNFIGTVQADSLASLRTYHNFYLQYEPAGKFGLIAGFDIGTDKYNTKDYGIWLSPVVIIRYSLNNAMKLALRGEYYSDKNQIIIASNSASGIRLSGISTNFDYRISEQIQFRIEGKYFYSAVKIFKA